MKAIQNIGYRLPKHAGTFWRRSSSVELLATVSNAGGLGAYEAYIKSSGDRSLKNIQDHGLKKKRKAGLRQEININEKS